MTACLVTGASGFIGSHLVDELLRRGHEVRCLVRRTSSRSNLPKTGVTWVEGDMTDPATLPAAVIGCDFVYHVAGLTSAFHTPDLWRVNGDGTGALASACAAQSRPPVFVYVSSIAAAGPTARDQMRTEDDPPKPISNYGNSKRTGEEKLEALADRLPITIVRPGIVFGPRNRDLLPVFQSIRRFHMHAFPGGRTPALSYIYVFDLIDLLCRAADRGTRLSSNSSKTAGTGPGYYFATSDEFPTYVEFGRLVGRVLHSPMLLLPVLPPLPWIVASFSEVIARWRQRPSTFNRDKILEASAESWACSSRRAQQELEFRSSAALLEQLATTANWYREHGWL